MMLIISKCYENFDPFLGQDSSMHHCYFYSSPVNFAYVLMLYFALPCGCAFGF